MLHDMERKGYLHSVESDRDGKLTAFTCNLGKTMLEDAREKSELFGELFEEQ